VGPGNRVLDGDPDLHQDWAILGLSASLKSIGSLCSGIH